MFYLTKESLPVFIPLGFIGVYRWFFFVIRFIAYLLYVPKHPSKRPKYTPSRDVTIIIPTIDSGPDIIIALKSLLANNPFEILFVTVPSAEEAIQTLIDTVEPGTRRVRIVTVARGNKRNQMVAGINQCRTEIIVFCDDDVIYGPRMLKWILAPFEDRQMGAVGKKN